MRIVRGILALSAFTVLTGCFHQAVQTGLAPSTTVVQKNFHPTWVFGLVKAKPIDVRQQCPNGVAFASTRMTFVNGLAGMVTLGLFTPHEVKITCASAGTSMLPGSVSPSPLTLDAFGVTR
jgi:hypothetical protein